MNTHLPWREKLIDAGLIDFLARFHRHYFQLEVLGQENLPPSAQGNALFVMNHTAVFGLEVQLFLAYLLSRDAGYDLRVLVWPGYLNSPIGRLMRAMGCAEATIDGGAEQLKTGKSVLIMPEGVGATDVRQRFNSFHSGYLRMLKAAPHPLIPVGFFGVDQSIPWVALQNRRIARYLMGSIDPSFDFLIAPKPPLFRPVKVVLNIGKPRTLEKEELSTEDRLQETNRKIREDIITLAQDAERYRQECVAASPLNRLYHRWMDGEHSILGRG